MYDLEKTYWSKKDYLAFSVAEAFSVNTLRMQDLIEGIKLVPKTNQKYSLNEVLDIGAVSTGSPFGDFNNMEQYHNLLD